MTSLDFISIVPVEIDVRILIFSFFLELFNIPIDFVTVLIVVTNATTDCCYRPDAVVSATSKIFFIDYSTTIMLDYVRQRSSTTISRLFFFLTFLTKFFMYFQLVHFCLNPIDAEIIDTSPSSLQTLLKLRTARVNNDVIKRSLRIIYFREFDVSIDEHRLKFDVKNLTEVHGIDFKLNILDQSRSFSLYQFCSIIGQERRDTILVADLYTKEIDFISRALKIPTIAITNRYQIVQGKLVSVCLSDISRIKKKDFNVY